MAHLKTVILREDQHKLVLTKEEIYEQMKKTIPKSQTL